MRQGNKATRTHAIPFVSEFVDFSATTYGDAALSVPENISNDFNVAAVPMTQPANGDVVEAYLYMEMTAPSNKSLQVYLGIGTFSSGVIPDLSPGDIGAMHRKITGSDSPFTVAANGTLVIDADLTRSLYRRGDAEFLDDAFVLLVQFVSLPSSLNGYSLDKFKLNCSAQMGLGT